ncbi:MAG TPA: fructose-6-phosphate aldolase [Ruminococcaceae bacterium]|jgi:TalC/MipB family fructose-6-phosphate aldolase|nr:fructose-6-phosphate aldolase [Oscillospiraceae bacterium]
MKLIVDDADLESIRQIYEYFPCAGVTTNPSILLKAKRPPYEALKAIRELIGPDAELHAQVVGAKAEDMVKEGHRICEVLGGNTFIKVPVTREGLKAIKILGKEGYSVTATAVYTQMQAYLAGQAGAAYAAPYINRIDNLGANGVSVAKDIHDIFRRNNMKAEVLAASFKNTQQVLELAKYGVGAATVSAGVIEGFLKLDAVASAVDRFTCDFYELCGEGKTML